MPRSLPRSSLLSLGLISRRLLRLLRRDRLRPVHGQHRGRPSINNAPELAPEFFTLVGSNIPPLASAFAEGPAPSGPRTTQRSSLHKQCPGACSGFCGGTGSVRSTDNTEVVPP